MKIRSSLTIAAVLFLSIGMCGSVWAEDDAAKKSGTDWTDEVRNLLESFHVSAPKQEDLEKAEVEAMVRSLNDPYTEYYSQAESERMLGLVNAEVPAIGVQLDSDEGGVYVTRVEPGSPADKNGLKPGDRIDSVGGTAVTQANAGELFGKERKEGTGLNLTVSRGAEKLDKSLVVEKVKYSPVRAAMFPGGIGMLRLLQFTGDADEPFTKELAGLEAQGMKVLILDLRSDGGGYIETAKKIAAHFMKDGLLAKTKSRDGEGKIEVKDGRAAPYPIYCLVDDYTASASEMLAGALQDAKLATVIGSRTYGKGVAQLILPLLSGKGMLKITTMEYFTPSGQSVNRVGIKPDVKADGELEPLLRALRLAGARELTMTVDGGSVTLNGVALPLRLSVYRQDGAVYVPIRVLAGVAGADVAWNAGDWSVTVTSDGQAVRFAADELQVRRDVRYADIAAFASRVPGVKAEASGDVLTLQASTQ